MDSHHKMATDQSSYNVLNVIVWVRNVPYSLSIWMVPVLFGRLMRCGLVGDMLWKFKGYFQFVLSASCLGFKMWALSCCSSSHACLLLPSFPMAMNSHPSGSRSPKESFCICKLPGSWCSITAAAKEQIQLPRCPFTAGETAAQHPC